MDLTKRQGSILELLLRGERETTIGSIATRVGVSPRTVHRELARIASPLRRDFGLTLSTRSGHGIVLVGTSERMAECRAELEASVPSDLDAEDRRRMLAVSLLDADDAVKTFALASDIGTTALQVRHDLELLRPWLEIHGLSLVLRRGFGVSVSGDEERKREALRSIVMEQFGEAGILDLIRNEGIADSCPDEPIVHLFSHFPPERFREAEAALASLDKGVLPPLAPRDYLALVAHVAIARERCMRGRAAEEAANEAPEEAEFDAALAARAIAAAAAKGAPDMESPAEIGSVERFLRGAKLERPSEDLLETGVGSIAEVRALIAECSRIMDRDFAADRNLRDGLAAHWGPAHYRLRNRLPIRNPILDQIKDRYGPLFSAVRDACGGAFPDLSVPDDEVGYLVLHFGSSIERSGAGIERFRALVVCSAGIGSARMLASRIRTELPEIDIVANLSWFDVKDSAPERWDLLISTIPLPLPPDEYVLVDPLLSDSGLKAIKEHMANKRTRMGSRGEPAPEAEERRAGTLGELKQMSRHLAAAIAVLERLRVFADAKAGEDWEALLREAVGRCADAGLADDREQTLRDLRERSRDRGIILPETRILFLHARSAGVSAPSLSLHAFAASYRVREERWETKPNRLALMLAPRALDRETQDILNEISVSLLDARTAEILQSADEADMRSHFSRYLDRYFRSSPLQGA